MRINVKHSETKGNALISWRCLGAAPDRQFAPKMNAESLKVHSNRESLLDTSKRIVTEPAEDGSSVTPLSAANSTSFFKLFMTGGGCMRRSAEL